MAKHKKQRHNNTPHSRPPPRQSPGKASTARPAKSADSKPTSAPKNQTKELPPTIPFHADDRILLVGEGDFSFSKSLVEHHGCYDVTATCYDSEAGLHEKYAPQASEHISYLEDAGQTVLYGVDATRLSATKALSGDGGRFDRIVFNFPHVGGKSTDVNRQVRFNQELLVKFFEGARGLLAEPGGSIAVTLFEGEPYTLWNVRDLARHADLQVLRSFRFQSRAYPGYRHARTLGNLHGEGAWRGEDREARTYLFGTKEDAAPARDAGKKRKRKDRDESPGDDDD